MDKRPILAAVCGVKNSGKTTLIEKLTSRLSAMGKRVAVIKHDGHDFTCDIPGTDTYRFAAAGACGTAAFSENRTFIHRVGISESEAELIGHFPDADVILIEGLKNSPLSKIELVRSAVSMEPVSNPAGRFLVVSDLPPETFHEESAAFDDIEKIIHLILNHENRPASPGSFAEDTQTVSCQSAEMTENPNRAENQDMAMISKMTEDPERNNRESMENQLTHFDEHGQAIMVDVTKKIKTDRTAIAKGRIRVSEATMQAIREGTAAKGDVLSVARIAGIMAVKRTSDLIPLCHPLPVGKCSVDFQIDEAALEVEAVCTVSLHGQTGVEMEALTGVSVTLLTIYDMCKAIDKRMEITGIHLARKTGGKSGDFINDRNIK